MPDRHPRKRIARRLAVFGPAAIVVLTGLLGAYAVRQVTENRDWVQHTHDVLDASSSFLTAMLDAETSSRGYVLIKDSTLLAPYATAAQRERDALATLRQLTGDNPDQQRRIDTLEAKANAKLALIDTAVQWQREGRFDLAHFVGPAAGGPALMTTIRTYVDTVEREEESLLRVRRAREARSTEITALIILMGTLLAAGLAFSVNRNFDRALVDRRKALDDATLANERLQEAAIELEHQADAAQSAAVEAEEARTSAESANRAKAAFLASMSHELRTPLQAALGFAQLVRSGVYGVVNENQAEVLGRVERSQMHLARLIDDILDFARLEAGRVRVEMEVVPLAEAFGDLAPLVEPQAAKKKIELSILPPSDDLRVNVDRQRLQQILVNLVGNAIKFTPENGMIRVGALRDTTHVAIQIRDTGIGIPSDRLEAIFEPFVQVEDSLTRTAPGTGLGLAISRDLARAMGGDLKVESELGKGSTFEVVVPVANA